MSPRTGSDRRGPALSASHAGVDEGYYTDHYWNSEEDDDQDSAQSDGLRTLDTWGPYKAGTGQGRTIFDSAACASAESFSKIWFVCDRAVAKISPSLKTESAGG